MGAEIIPFARTASEAWAAYHALMQEAKHNPELGADRDHLDRRIAAHRRFTTLFERECQHRSTARSA